MERKLDWKPRFDEESKNYPVRGILKNRIKRKDVLWKPGQILDQGSEGACVGFGWTADSLAQPHPVDLAKIPGRTPKKPEPFARHVYKSAKKIDEYPGEDYEGTSVLAGAKVMQGLKTVASYSWAFSIDDVIDALIEKGPVVLGIPWYEGMYSAPSGVLLVSGELVGGHCLLAVGYNVKSKALGGRSSIILQNSWGRGWGVNGLAEIAVTDLAKLLSSDGEACIASKFPYVKKTTVASRLINLFTK